jgi:competence protein ComEC
MGDLFVTAIALGRRSTAYVSLFATVLILTLINPMSFWDVGFQLSFAATLGLILFTPGIERLFERGLVHISSPERSRQALRFLNDALILILAAGNGIVVGTPLQNIHAFKDKALRYGSLHRQAYASRS